MSAKDLISRGVKTVQGSNKSNPFPGKSGGSPRVGNQYPRSVGMGPKVVRADAKTPILPKSMVIGNVIDESVNGGKYKF